MNVCTFTGNLGKDCRLGNVGGTTVCNFTLAARAGFGKSEQTLWLDCALWGKRGESLQQYLTKGQQVAVSGELGTREHEGKTYLTLRVSELTLMGGRREERSEDPQPAGGAGQGGGGFGDEIPFARMPNL